MVFVLFELDAGWFVGDFRTLALFQRSEMSPELFQDFMDGYIKPLTVSPLAVEHSVLVITAGSQSRWSKIDSYG